MAGFQMRRDRQRRVDDIGQVGLVMLRQGRRHADQDGIDIAQPLEVSSGGKAAFIRQLAHQRGRNMLDIALAARQRFSLFGINVKADDSDPGAGSGNAQGQANIAKTNHSNFCRLAMERCKQCCIIQNYIS